MKYNLTLGVTLSLLASFFYAAQTAIVKTQAAVLPPLPVVIFIQSLVSLLLILPFIFKNGRSEAKRILSTRKIHLHLLRTLFSLSISFLLFYAVTFIPLVNGLLLANTAPLIVPVLGYVFLSQKINHRMWLPMIIGFAGVFLVLNPDTRIFNPASLLAFGAAIAMASTMLTVRRLAATEATETTAFYFFLFSSIISGLIALKFWMPLNLQMLMVMTSIGALYFLTQYASTSALRFVNAQLVGTLFYSTIIYAAVISLFIWHILPGATTLSGMVLVIAGGILCIRVEHAKAANPRIECATRIQGKQLCNA